MKIIPHPGGTQEGMRNVHAVQEKNLSTAMEDTRGLIIRKHTKLFMNSWDRTGFVETM